MITIIVPSKTEQDKYLKECLDSIDKQTFRHITVIKAIGGELATTRKKAILEAKTKYIMLLDSDQIMTPNVLEECVKACESGFEGVTLWEKSLEPKTWLEKVIAYDKELFHSAHDDDPIKGAAEPRFFRSSYLKNLDFAKLPPLTFELTLINKQVKDMGARIKFLEVNLYHHEPATTKQLFKKFFRYGYYYIPSIRMYPEVVLNHSKPRRVYFTKKAISRPILYVGLWVHYGIKALSTGLGVLWYLSVNINGFRKK